MRYLVRLALLPLIWTTSALAQAPAVVVDIAPLHSLVKMVMGDLGDPILLTSGHADPHHIHLRPSQARQISQAEIVFWIGPQLTPWLDKAVSSLGKDIVSIPLLADAGTVIRVSPNQDNLIDPHAWLDPDNAKYWLPQIAKALSQLDPENRKKYAGNAERAQTTIAAIEAEISILLKPILNGELIFAHDAFGYFSDRFGLHSVAVIRENGTSAPGAAHLIYLREIIESGSISCVFGEPEQTESELHLLVKDTNIPFIILDPLGRAFELGPDLYTSTLLSIADAIGSCQT